MCMIKNTDRCIICKKVARYRSDLCVRCMNLVGYVMLGDDDISRDQAIQIVKGHNDKGHVESITCPMPIT